LFSIQIQTTCAYVGVAVTRPHGAVDEDDAAMGEDSEATGNGGEVVAATLGVACATRADADGGEGGVLLGPTSRRALAVQAASAVTVKVTTASCRTAGLAIEPTVSIDSDAKMTVI
jgi:hypothetical protein